jgi:hypothetical protein
MPARTPEEIRASIEHNRQQLGQSLELLRGEVTRMTDWRAQLREHQRGVIVTAAVAGFVLGGGLAAFSAMLGGGGRRRRKKR